MRGGAGIGGRIAAMVVAGLALASGVLPAAAEGSRETPRFASLGADRVNVRTGPGVRYPVVWVFVRKGLPVEITAEFELWRRIRDIEGSEGWVHKSLLSGRRTVLVKDKVRTFYRGPDADRLPAFLAEPGVVAQLRGCRGDWCEVQTAGLRGWAPRRYLWGVYADEGAE